MNEKWFYLILNQVIFFFYNICIELMLLGLHIMMMLTPNFLVCQKQGEEEEAEGRRKAG